jgi:hypothetical protein
LAQIPWDLGLENQQMSALFDGPPVLAKTKLDPAAYVEEKVQKLANAQIAYINWEAIEEMLKEIGFKETPKSLTPELAKAILDRAGFAKQLPGESIAAYTAEFRSHFSIRYGGRYINYNFGSGRNGATGMVDVKGIGRTALVRPWADSGHSSGGMGLEEAIKEAIWSNVLHRELPFGANRVLFVMTTGTLINPADPNSQPRAILVRQDPVRPAYFQPNDGVRQTLMSDELRLKHTAADEKRMERLLPRLIDALPKAGDLPAGATDAEKLSAGMFAMAERIAHQYATAYTRQILLAGASTSNVEIDGRALDYGTTTALKGYPRVSLLAGESPNGTSDTLKSDIVLELAQDLRTVLPEHLMNGFPSDEALSKRLDARYQQSLLRGFLELAGTPKEYSEKLSRQVTGEKLGMLLKTIAQAGNEDVAEWRHERMPRTGTYNLETVLRSLIGGNERDLMKALPDHHLRQQLQTEFTSFRKELTALAKKDGISAKSLQTYMELAVPARNRALVEIHSGKAFFEDIAAAGKRFGKSNPEALQNYINRMVAKNVREFPAGKFQLSVNENHKVMIARGYVTRKVFDLRTGKTTRAVETLRGFSERRVIAPSCAHVF